MLEDLRRIFDETMTEYQFWAAHIEVPDDRIVLAQYYGQLCGIAKCAQIIYGVDAMIDDVEALHPRLFKGDDE